MVSKNSPYNEHVYSRPTLNNKHAIAIARPFDNLIDQRHYRKAEGSRGYFCSCSLSYGLAIIIELGTISDTGLNICIYTYTYLKFSKTLI